MAEWVFCVTCTSTINTGDFNEGAFWWNATTATSNPLDPPQGKRFVPHFAPGDNVYWAVQVDASGTNNNLVTDLRAAVGRKKIAGATISSPFKNGNFSLQNVGGPPSALSLTGTNPPNGPWVATGPYTVVSDSGRPGQSSRYAFVLTAALGANGPQFGEDPEMDVDNGS